MSMLVQIAGALAILVAFVGVQSGRLRPTSYASLLLNVAGSAVLAVLALLGSQWGFVLLEATWAVVSAGGIYARATRSAQSSTATTDEL